MAHKNVKTNISKNCPKWKMTLYSKISKNIIFFVHWEFFLFFLAPFFLWILAGWYTLDCLWNREYFIYFLPLTYSLDLFAAALHVHMRTKVQLDFDPQLLLYIYPSNHFLPLKQSSWNLSRYLDLEKSQLKNFTGTRDLTRSETPNHAFDAYTVE